MTTNAIRTELPVQGYPGGQTGCGVRPNIPDSYLLRMTDHVPAVLTYWDRNLTCRFGNRTCAEWFGVPRHSLINMSLVRLIGDELFEQSRESVAAALAGKDRSVELVIRRPGMADRICLFSFASDSANRQVVGFTIQITDVTCLKNTESTLRAEVLQRENALAHLKRNKSALKEAQRLGNLGSWEWEVDTDIVTWSEQLYRIFARDPRSLPPSFAEHQALYEPESWSRLRNAVARTLQSRQPYQLELQYNRPDGTGGWIDARAEAVVDECGKVIKLRGTALDITARRQYVEDRFQKDLAEQAGRNKALVMNKLGMELQPLLDLSLRISHQLADPQGPFGLELRGALERARAKLTTLTREITAEAPLPRICLAPWQVKRAMQIMTDRMAAGPSLVELGTACQLSPAYFAKAFKASVGLPPHRWLMEARINHAKHLILHSEKELSDVASECGFADQSHFTRAFKAAVGTSPGIWRKNFKR